MVEIFRAGRQLAKVRAIMWLSLGAAAVALWAGWALFDSYGTSPADGGVLAPLGTRLAWGVTVAALGLAFAGGMWLYGGLYVTTLVYDERSDRLYVRTLTFVGHRNRVFSAGDVDGSSFHGGEFWAGGVWVNAPWVTLRMRGRSLPFIVDAQGEFPDRELGRRLFGGH